MCLKEGEIDRDRESTKISTEVKKSRERKHDIVLTKAFFKKKMLDLECEFTVSFLSM